MSEAMVNINVTPSKQPDGLVHKWLKRTEKNQHHKYSCDFGMRRENDEEVGHMFDSDRWLVPHDVVLTIRFPVDREKILTYVEIDVHQSSVERSCKIINGGTGENFIELLITAKNTYWIQYDARFYAVNQK